MAFPVFLDTCAIFGQCLNDFLLRLAARNMYRPLWSADVLAELHRNLAKHGITEEAINRRIATMTEAFPDAEVRGYEDLLDLDGNAVVHTLRDTPAAYENPPIALSEFCDILVKSGVPDFVHAIMPRL